MNALVASALLVFAVVPQDAAERLVERTRSTGVMGKQLDLSAYGSDAAKLDAALDAAVAEMRRVEDLMTTWRPSALTRLNDAAGRGPQTVPPELARLIARALEIGRLTKGAFDVTYYGVGKLWDFKAEPPRIPDEAAIARALERVGFARVTVDLDASTVTLPEGMAIGLGGIAKGYGVDRAMAVLMQHGVEHAIVNAAGDLKALGRKQGELWRIAIKHPRDRERVLAVVPLSNTCLVTSGDYERFFEHDGERYHHIIDPRTGYPSKGCMSATVTAPDAAFADALATALCVLSPDEGLALIEGLERVEAFLVGQDGELRVTSGLKSALAD